ncbi:MAG: hypothetical protein AABZ39_01645 [Spirochaetota bacterium]
MKAMTHSKRTMRAPWGMILFILASLTIYPRALPIIAADWPAWKDGLGKLLIMRSMTMETQEIARANASNWSTIANVADMLRGRALVLAAARNIAPDDENTMLASAEALADKVISLEAGGVIMQASPVLADKTQRGWGIETTYNLRGVIGVNTVDLWNTASCLAALTDWLPFAKRKSKAHYTKVLASATDVMDQWIQRYSTEHPTEGSYFYKIGTADPGIKNFLIFNTESLMAISLWNLAKAHREDGHADIADRYAREAVKHGRQMKRGVTERIRDDAGIHAERWSYMVENINDKPFFGKSEDIAHGGVTIDVIYRFFREDVRENGKPLFVKEDLAAIAQIMAENVFVYRDDATPAYTVWYRPDRSKPKQVYTEYRTSDPVNAEWQRETAWRYILIDDKKRVELGHGLRTGWGWVAAASADANVLAHVYRYYATYLNTDIISPEKVPAKDVTRKGAGLYISLATLWSVMP